MKETTALLLKNRNREGMFRDKFEIFVIIGILLSTGIFVTSFFQNPSTLNIIIKLCIILIFLISEWRIRKLAIAKKLMESVNNFSEENIKLKNEINVFRDENDKFKEILGLFGDNVEDIEKTKKDLIDLYEKYRIENERYVSNNLLNLFGLVDKDQNSILDENEIKRMKEYIKIVYKQDFDFDILDKNQDGSISLKEFFDKFRSKNI